MGGGLAPFLLALRFIWMPNANGSHPHQDRHKTPTSTQPFPLSLQDAEQGRLPDAGGKIHQDDGNPFPCSVVKAHQNARAVSGPFNTGLVSKEYIYADTWLFCGPGTIWAD